MPVVTLLGLVGNTLAILVLHSPGVDMKVCSSYFFFLSLFFMNNILVLVLALVLFLVLFLHSPEVDMKVCSIFHNRPFWCSSVIHDITLHYMKWVFQFKYITYITKISNIFCQEIFRGESLRTPKVIL